MQEKKMKKSFLTALSGLILIVTLCGLSTSAKAANSYVTLTGTRNYSFAQEVVELVNVERTNRGMRALAIDGQLTDAAMLRAAECAVKFEHDRPNGLLFNSAAGNALSENIAIGETTPEQVVTDWLNSPVHREAMLNPAWRVTGVGTFNTKWCQLFGTDMARPMAYPDLSEPVAHRIELREDLWPYLSLSDTANIWGAERRNTLVEGASLELYTYISTMDEYSKEQVPNGDVSWSSSDPSVATVERGVITARKAGHAVITATLCQEKTNYNINVIEPIHVSQVILDRGEAALDMGQTLGLKATVLPEDATNKKVRFQSSNEAVAQVNQAGVISAMAPGTAEITAISEDGGKTANCTVTVEPLKDENGVFYNTHVQNQGWKAPSFDGSANGTVGSGYRLEAIKIDVNDVWGQGDIEYRTQIENKGWDNWVKNGGISGSSGEGLRLEAIRVRLTGELSQKYDVYYCVHSQNMGWMSWAKNGDAAGTAGQGLRLEAIKIKLVEKGQPAPAPEPGADEKAFRETRVIGTSTHVQNVGWQPMAYDGAVSGTAGLGYRLEGIKIALNAPAYEGGVEYKTHIENKGWEKDFKTYPNVSGTSGEGLRLEGIRIQLTKEMADRYDVYYQVHAQNLGWLGLAKNGEEAGTEGYGYRLEGIRVLLVDKDAPAPAPQEGSAKEAFYEKTV